MKSYFLMSVVAASLLLSGCGSSSDGGVVANTQESDNIVTVERGPLLDANVTDALGNLATELGEGKYSFEGAPEYPISAVGGYIDINRNGLIDAEEVMNTLVLESAQGSVITLATTMAMNEDNLATLEELYGISRDEINNQTPSSSEAIEAFSNTLYEYSIESGIENPSGIDLDTLKVLVSDFQEKQEEYRNDIKDVAEHEKELISSLGMTTLGVDVAQVLQNKLEEKLNMFLGKEEQPEQPESGMGEGEQPEQPEAGMEEGEQPEQPEQPEAGMGEGEQPEQPEAGMGEGEHQEQFGMGN